MEFPNVVLLRDNVKGRPLLENLFALWGPTEMNCSAVQERITIHCSEELSFFIHAKFA